MKSLKKNVAAWTTLCVAAALNPLYAMSVAAGQEGNEPMVAVPVASQAKITVQGTVLDETGIPVYGIEVGQRTEVNGEEVFDKYARFTANRLSFFDANGNEVAYISDYKLFISNVEVTGSYRIGHLVDTVQSDGSIVTKYTGG